MKKQTVEPKKFCSKLKPVMTKKIPCADLFCGCGGLTLGVHETTLALACGFRSKSA